MNFSDPASHTCSLMYFSIPESFFPSRLASETLFFREGVRRHDFSEHCQEHKIGDEECCILSKASRAVSPQFSRRPFSSNGRDDLGLFVGPHLLKVIKTVILEWKGAQRHLATNSSFTMTETGGQRSGITWPSHKAGWEQNLKRTRLSWLSFQSQLCFSKLLKTHNF